MNVRIHESLRFILGAQSEPLTIIEVLDPIKKKLGPQNGLEISGTKKLLKIVNCQKIVLS